MVISFEGFSQDRKMPIFIFQSEEFVIHWLDSINNLSRNPYYKIKREAADNGDLMLSSEYAMNEEYLYKCLHVVVRFRYVRGKNLCVRQLVYGSEQYAQDNLEFIRKNFTNTSSGEWEMNLGEEYNNLKIHADFSRTQGEYRSYFNINYELVSNKKSKAPNVKEDIEFNTGWVKIPEWENAYLLKEPIGKYINSEAQTVYKIWLKVYIFDPPAGIDPYISRMLIELNCSDPQYKMMTIDIYDMDDKLHKKEPIPKPIWEKIIPDTYMDEAKKLACQLFN